MLTTNPAINGVQFLLLEYQQISQPQPDVPREILDIPAQPYPKLITPKLKLQRQLTSLYLHNPFWNDFRLLNYLLKRNINITLADLQHLKRECGLENRESVCSTLLRLADEGGLQLNNNQISFITRVKPEYRDRDICPSQAGQMLVYECLSGRKRRNMNKVFIHFFVDMFTGYAFAQLSYQPSLAVALAVVENSVIPAYHTQGHRVQLVVHSSSLSNEIHELQDKKNRGILDKLDLKWVPTSRKFGTIDRFKQFIPCNDFFNVTCSDTEALANLQIFFEKWLANYNLLHSHAWHKTHSKFYRKQNNPSFINKLPLIIDI